MIWEQQMLITTHSFKDFQGVFGKLFSGLLEWLPPSPSPLSPVVKGRFLGQPWLQPLFFGVVVGGGGEWAAVPPQKREMKNQHFGPSTTTTVELQYLCGHQMRVLLQKPTHECIVIIAIFTTKNSHGWVFDWDMVGFFPITLYLKDPLH